MKLNIKKLFLENIGIRQTILKNTFWLFLAEVVVRFLGLILIIYIARVLGATEYGKFVFALSFVSIISIFSDLGIVDISTREFSRDRDNEKKFTGIFTLELFLCFLSLFIIFISSFFITSDPKIQKIIWILAIFVLSNSLLDIIFSFLRARQKMEYEAAIKILQSLFNTVIVLSIIFWIPSIENLSYAYLTSNLIVLFLVLFFFNYYFQPLKLKWEKYSLNILKISWPLTLGFISTWFYLQLNSFMLGYFGLITENGWYGAASKIATAVILPSFLIVKSFYPTLSKFFTFSKEKFQKTWNYLIKSMILLAIPLVIGGITLSSKIISFLYGSAFAPSIPIFQFLIFIVGIGFLNFPYSVILIVAEKQKNNFELIMAGAIINIILDFFLIPLYGVNGVLVAMTIASLIVLFSTIVLVKYQNQTSIFVFNKRIVKTTIISSFSTLIMYFVISCPLLFRFNIVLLFFIGVFVYFFVLFILYRIFFKINLKFLFSTLKNQ